MERYYFSGSLTQEMHDLLLKTPNYQPIDVLVSQVDRSSVNKMIEWKKDGFIKTLFIDSGAFSIHTGKAKLPGWKGSTQPTFRDWEDAYIEYLNSIDEYIDVFAQLDTIPGKFGKPKTDQDYIESAKKSWENYLYMRERVKSPEKLMPVFHHHESIEVLKSMLEWRDENGKPLEYLGISPANDVAQKFKNIYLDNVTRTIAESSNPGVKTHLYGMTSLPALAQYKCYSADSISHRLISGYNKIVSCKFGVVSISKRPRTNKTKSNMSFVECADDYNLDIVKQELADLGFTLEQAQESVSVRVVINICNILKMINTTHKFDESKVVRTKKLFKL